MLEYELEEALRERDDAEDFIDELLDEVLGADRPEWSSAYNRYDAMNDVRERITALHKPAADKAWGRFESATAEPQPSPAAQGDALDAARWRALLACGRIRIIGTAGVTGTGAHDPKALDPNKQPYGNYVHFGAEFWSTFPDQDYYNTKENPAYARATLTEFADAARAAQEGKTP